ncbi:MAG: hypothetical protein HOK83_06735 [Rhodospirillaceae bacterium]|nr:hypothetical protein [Rhodospirillaceae bacterium]
MTRPFRFLTFVFLALSVWTGSCITTPSARAQDAGRIAAVVNEDAITLLDVFERMNIIIATSGIEVAADTRQRLLPQVLRTLIDEKLQMQEGARAGLDDVILLPTGLQDCGAESRVESGTNAPLLRVQQSQP